MNSPIQTLKLDDFWSCDHYLTTETWPRLPLRIPEIFCRVYHPHIPHILMLDEVFKKKFFFDPFLFMRFNCLSATEPLLRDSLISALSPQEFLLLIWLTWEKWKAESTLKSPCDFETWTLGLEIQRPNH